MEKILASLRANIEGTKTINGDKWGIVYLDNASIDGVSPHAFAGFLSALKKEGLYTPVDDDVFFGYVKL